MAKSALRSWPKSFCARSTPLETSLTHAGASSCSSNTAPIPTCPNCHGWPAIDRWRDEVLAYHHTGRASNGRVENVHMLAEKIRRNAHEFANHHNYRRCLIGRLGIKWATVPTRRIRGRQPRSVALSRFDSWGWDPRPSLPQIPQVREPISANGSPCRVFAPGKSPGRSP